MHKILNFLIIVLFKSTKGAEYMEAKMKLDNFRFDVNVIQTRHKGDVTDCAVKCTSRLDCLSIQYRDSTQTCRMFDTIFLTSDGASYENGWRYYLKTGGICPPHFTFTAIDGLCFHDGGELRRDAGVKYCAKVGSGLILVSSANIEFFLESILDRVTPSYSGAKSAYIQGQWNSTHWLDDDGQELQYTNWEGGTNNPGPSRIYNIKIKQSSGGYYWKEATSGNDYVRHVFCGVILR
ncbi:uncharacterized protein LOC128163547 [Crassostrea angulata]|uniref:uncharacterized protein LOC128163547 n=1 Tax=Magallana angulata TaxID=2784310 RepID=UPI0022B0C28D|nr:uncharacterized protein LOC128163547 [Crassostrea angulata]